MIKGVTFDLEGTLVDVEPAHHQGHLRAAAEVGVHLTLDDALVCLPHFIGGPDEEVVREIAALAGGRARPGEILAATRRHYRELLPTLPIAPRPGVLELIARLDDAGLPMAIGSLTDSVEARLLLERSGLNMSFPSARIVLREDVAAVKPAPDVFLETARRMAIDPRNQLVFEDSPNGIRAALAAGSTPVAMPVYRLKDTLAALVEAGATRVFLDWREFNALQLVANVGEEVAR